MPLDFRYHVASLIAVFCALILGVLVGIALIGDPAQLQQMAGQLRRDNQHTREYKEQELKTLQASQTELQDLVRQVLPTALKDRLAGRRVTIVLDHPFPKDELVDNINARLLQAGAVVSSVITIRPAFMHLRPEVEEAIRARLGISPAEGDLRVILARRLGPRLASGSPELPDYLRSAGLISVGRGADYRQPSQVFLLLGGAAKPDEVAMDTFDIPFVEGLQEVGPRVVGAEARTAVVSLMPALKAKNVPTVDNVDTLSGRVALVLALAGADGHYGEKETADALLPSME